MTEKAMEIVGVVEEEEEVVTLKVWQDAPIWAIS